MAKKIEVDISYLKKIGVSQSQVKDIVRRFDPEHWTNSLPQDDKNSFSLRQILFTPNIKFNKTIEVKYDESSPAQSFFSEEDADFIADKFELLMEMSNFSFAVNKDWTPDWNNSNQSKYGIVLKNGKAQVSENPVFNLYVFGIVVKTQKLGLEMLEEFKERIELFFNKPFYSVLETQVIEKMMENIEEVSQEVESNSDIDEDEDDISILDIDLSVRALNAIYANYERFVPDNTIIRNRRGIKLKHFKHITRRQLANFRNIGAKTVQEIENKLLEHGIELPKHRFFTQ